MRLVNHKSPMPLLLTSLQSSSLCSQRNALQPLSPLCEFSIFCQPLWASHSLRKLLAIIWFIHGNNRQTETSSSVLLQTTLLCFIRIDASSVKSAFTWLTASKVLAWRREDISVGKGTGFPSFCFFVPVFHFRSSLLFFFCLFLLSRFL